MLGVGAKAVSFQIPISPNFAAAGIPPIPSKSSFGKPRRSFSLLSSSSRSSRNSFFHIVKVVPSSSVGNAVYTEEEEEEPATKVKFQTTLTIPGCSTSLSLLGTGYREKVFAIIGVKVYAAGLYIDESILSNLNAWRGRSLEDIKGDSSLFNAIFQNPIEKSLQIVLVRDVDGKTFWDALNDAISPRLVSPTTIDQSALSTFRGFFQGRSLNKGTVIFLTWLDPTKMLVGVSDGGTPTTTIESSNVAWALFDVFFGKDPVSPSLKDSVARGLMKLV